MDRRPYIGRKPEKAIVAAADWLQGKVGIYAIKWHPHLILQFIFKIIGDHWNILRKKQYDLIGFVWHYFGCRNGGGIGCRKGLSRKS